MFMNAAGLLPAFDLTLHRLARRGADAAYAALAGADRAALKLAKRRAATLRGLPAAGPDQL